jgi:hypothetical protein
MKLSVRAEIENEIYFGCKNVLKDELRNQICKKLVEQE